MAEGIITAARRTPSRWCYRGFQGVLTLSMAKIAVIQVTAGYFLTRVDDFNLDYTLDETRMFNLYFYKIQYFRQATF